MNETAKTIGSPDVTFNGSEWRTGGQTIFTGSCPSAEIDGVRITAQLESASASALEFSFPGTGLRWNWKLQVRGPRVIVGSTLVNTSDQPIELGELVWTDAEDHFLSGADPAEIIVLETPYRQLGYSRQLKKLSDPKAFRSSANFVQFMNEKTRSAVQIGFLTFRKALTKVHYRDRLQAVCEFAGWKLAPGKECECDVFTLVCGSDPMAQLEEWADLAAEICRPVFRKKPALGWSGGSWTSEADNADGRRQQRLLENLPLLQEKLGGYGLEFVWVSLANLPGGNPGAWMEWNSRTLPCGLDALVREIGKYGLKLGFWVGPYLLSSHLPEMVEEFRPALLRREADGEPIVYYPVWSHGDARLLPRKDRPCVYALDPSHPAVIEMLDKVFAFYREHGIRYYMLDFLEAASGSILRHPYREHWDSALVAGPETLVEGLKKMRETIGRDTFILTSTGPLLQMAGFADAVRTGNDFGEGRAVAPDSNFYPASFVINGSFTSASTALDMASCVYYMHNKLFLNDSGNMLTVDQPIPLESARIHATIHALSGASSMLGDDLRNIAPERLSLIRKTLPRATANAKPVDLFDSAQWPPHRFHRHIERGEESFEVLALYNFSGEPKKETVELARLGLPETCRCQIWEFWTENYCGSCQGTFETVVPPESVRVFRLTPEAGRPVILGTDLHVLMGEMELSDVRWDGGNRTLEFTADRPAGERGSVFLWMPQHLHIVDSGVCYTARNRHGTEGELIVRIPLAFDGRPVRKTIRFAGQRGGADDRFM